MNLIKPSDIGAPTTAEFNSLKTSVSEGKALIATAVTGKGVQTAADATFQTMATNIGSIPTGYTRVTGHNVSYSGNFCFRSIRSNSATLSNGVITCTASGQVYQGYNFTITYTINLA